MQIVEEKPCESPSKDSVYVKSMQRKKSTNEENILGKNIEEYQEIKMDETLTVFKCLKNKLFSLRYQIG